MPEVNAQKSIALGETVVVKRSLTVSDKDVSASRPFARKNERGIKSTRGESPKKSVGQDMTGASGEEGAVATIPAPSEIGLFCVTPKYHKFGVSS